MSTNKLGITRRNLLSTAAVGSALLTVASAGVAFADETSWDKEADVVVVGLGGAGAAAAAAAVDGGAKVLVLESEEQGGGSTAICGGLIYLGGGTQTQIDAGVEDTPENMYAYLNAAMGPSANQELLKVFCDRSLDTYSWLLDMGVTFDGKAFLDKHYVVAPEGGVLTYSGNECAPEYAAVAEPAPRGHTPNGGGAAIVDALAHHVESSELGEIVYGMRATNLVKDDEGAVVGVIAQDAEGEQVRIHATKGVVLAAGAFTYNEDMLADYAPEALLCIGKTGVPSDRGDGILMGLAAGAQLRSISRLNISQFMYIYGGLATGLMLSKRGLRFAAEDWYGAWIGRAVAQDSSDKCYIILDSESAKTVEPTYYGMMIEPDFQDDTIEGLIEQIGLPQDASLASVERYNSLCERGEDSDFGKPLDYLLPVKTGPFYAYDASSARMGNYHTLGGLKINANAEVLSVDGSPIPGLYAAGRTSSGIYGEYPASGTSVADCVIFGRIAGEQAATR